MLDREWRLIEYIISSYLFVLNLGTRFIEEDIASGKVIDGLRRLFFLSLDFSLNHNNNNQPNVRAND